MQYKLVARQLIEGCCELHPAGALTLVEMVEKVANEDDRALLLDDDNDARRKNRQAKLLLALRDALVEYDKRRMIPPLRESDVRPGSYMYAYADDESAEEDHRALLARLRLQVELRRLLQAMDDAVFEKLCAVFMEAAGCVGLTVSEVSKDKGLDFTGRLPLRAAIAQPTFGLSPFFRVAGDISFMVFGQAKRYGSGNSVGREPVAQLLGDWRQLLAEKMNGTIAHDRLSALKRASFAAGDPTILVFATTSQFTSGALDSARELGIVSLDGEQLAQLLIESGIGFKQVNVTTYETNMDLLEAASTRAPT